MVNTVLLGVLCSAVVSGERSAECKVSGEYSAARCIVYRSIKYSVRVLGVLCMAGGILSVECSAGVVLQADIPACTGIRFLVGG